MADEANTPLVAYAFGLEMEGVQVAEFKSISGLETTVEVTELRQAGADGKIVVNKIPGQVKYGDVTFSRGFTKDSSLYDWYKEIVDGTITTKLGSVVIYDLAGTETARWNLEACWPSVLKINGLEAGQSEVMIEEMTFVTNRIERVIS